MSSNRRDFLKTVIPVGALACFGCSTAFAASGKAAPEHKFAGPSGMSYEQVFDFAFGQYTIPTLMAMAKAMGKAEFIEMIKNASYDAALEIGGARVAEWPKRDFATFKAKLMASLKSPFMNNAATFEYTSNTDKEISLKVTECLWAKTFHKAGAEDLGYAMICHPDYAFPKAVSADMKMIRTRTLMQGHSCCDHKYVVEG